MPQNKGIGPLIYNKLFDGVKESSIKLSIRQNNFLTFREGDVIFQSNDESENIYLILDGEVKLKIPNNYGSSIIHQKLKNDFFGEIELVEKTRRKTSAVAETDCVIYILSRNELFDLLANNQVIKKNIFSSEISEETEITNFNTESFNADNNEINEFSEPQTIEEQQYEAPKLQSDDINFEIENPIDEDIKIIEMNNSIVEEENLTKDETDILDEVDPINYSHNLDDEINLNTKLEEDKLDDDLGMEDILPEIDNTTANDYLNEQKIYNNESTATPELIESEIDYQKILESARKIYQQSNLEGTVHSITGVLFELFDPQIVQVFLLDKDKNELWSFPFMENINEKRRIKIGDSLLGNCAASGQTINLINPSSNDKFNKQIDSIDFIDDEDVLIFPVKNKSDEIICIIQLINSGKGGFNKNDELILSEISKDISIAIELFELKEQKSDIVEQTEIHPEKDPALLERVFPDEIKHWNKAIDFISNNLKSLFTLVKRYSDFIKRKSENKEIKEASDFIKGQANSAIKYSELVIEYLNGNISLNKEVMNLNSTLDELLEMLAEYVESKDVKLYKKYDPNVFIKVDKLAFYFVCFQLTKNACEAMPSGGNIYISTNQQNDFVKIEIRDTGNGIEKEIQEKIFDPYFSFGKGNKPGLGLSISTKIIKEHDGVIELGPVSREGASFIIYLPIIKMD